MSDVKYRVSGEFFRSLLTQMDSLSTEELLAIQDERAEAEGGCSKAFYHVMLAIEDLARVELVNRDLIRNARD